MLKNNCINAKTLLVADQAIVSGASLLTQLMIAKMLGLKIFGFFSAMVLVQLFLLSIQQSMLSGVFQVAYGMNNDKAKLISSAWTIMLGYIIMIGFTLAITAMFYKHALGQYCVAVLLNIVFFLLQDFFRRIFITKEQGLRLVFVDLMNNGLQVAGLTGLFIWHTDALQLILWVCCLSYVPALVISFLWVRPTANITNAKDFINDHKNESGWMGLSAILQWLAGNFYIVAAGWWLGAAALGLLRLGQYTFGVLNIILQAVEGYIIPKASHAAAIPQNAILYLKKVQRKMFLYMILLAPVIITVAKPIGSYFSQADTDSISVVVSGLCLVYLVMIVTYPLRIALRILKMNRVYFNGYVINAFIGLCTAYLLIYSWQLKGALAGLLLSQLVLLVYWAAVLQKHYRIIWK